MLFSDPPEVTFNGEKVIERPLGGILSLTCEYSAVPRPAVHWYLNDTRIMSRQNSRITVAISDDTTVLTVVGLEQHEGGSYRCDFINSRGYAAENATVLLVLRTCSFFVHVRECGF